MDKSCSGCSRHIAGQGISAALFLQTGPQAVLPRMGAKHQRPLLRLPGLRSFHERQQPAEEDSENTNLPVLLRDDTICGVDGIVRVRREGIVRMAQHCACSLKSAMILLLRRHNIWPERFYRNAGVLNSREMARLLESRVFIAGCSVLGGHVAVLLARLGIGALRLCDPRRLRGEPSQSPVLLHRADPEPAKVLACRDGLLGMASYM